MEHGHIDLSPPKSFSLSLQLCANFNETAESGAWFFSYWNNEKRQKLLMLVINHNIYIRFNIIWHFKKDSHGNNFILNTLSQLHWRSSELAALARFPYHLSNWWVAIMCTGWQLKMSSRLLTGSLVCNWQEDAVLLKWTLNYAASHEICLVHVH